MPRMTRAALRNQENDDPQPIFEDPANISQSSGIEYDPYSTEHDTRQVLGELTGNEIPQQESGSTEILVTMPAKKIKGKKDAKVSKKPKIEMVVRPKDNSAMDVIIEDENQSDTSDAADIAAEILRRDQQPPETFQVPRDFARPKTPPSAAAQMATSNLLSPNKEHPVLSSAFPGTPRFDPNLHAAEDPIQNRATDDSFAETIIARSPVKTSQRIEDSIAEMDAETEAIEQVAQVLPVIHERDLESPTKTRHDVVPKVRQSPERKIAPASPGEISLARAKAMPVKEAAKASGTVHSKPATIRASLKTSNRTSMLGIAGEKKFCPGVAKPALSLSSSPAKVSTNTTLKRTKPRLASLSTSRPGFQPAKSNKPPTTSTFALPGEAVAAKLKAQREERQKREEEQQEALKIQNVGKPTAVKSSTVKSAQASISVGQPRQTKTSQVRKSFMLGKNSTGKENQSPVKAGSRATSTGLSKPSINSKPSKMELVVTKQRANLAKQTAQASKPAPPNSSIRRSNVPTTTSRPRPSTGPRTSHSRSSTTGTSPGAGPARKATLNKTDIAQQKQRAKEIFGRDKVEKESTDKARREKEEAAKRARAEAAERGRIASREWAERQRRRLAAEVRVGAKANGKEKVSGQEVTIN